MQYDVIILGAGLVGLTEALLCAKQGLSVALVDRNPAPHLDPTDDYDLRCFAISPGSQAIFESLGLWQALCQDRVSRFDQIKVWDAEGYGEINFQAEEILEPHFGYIIENRVMLSALWQAIQQQAEITLYLESLPNHFIKQKDHILLVLNDDRSFAAKVLVGADGGNSWLCEHAGFKTKVWDYQQKAIVAVVQTEHPHEQTAWQRFLKTGPLAFLPLSDPFLSSIVWTTTAEQADQQLKLSEKEFCDALSSAFDYQLGKVLSCGKRRAFPLKAQQATQVVAERIALIGDAAHLIHPLAGQGVNLGLQDAEVLSEILGRAKTQSYDIGQYLVLRQYERARKGPVALYLGATDFLQRFFGTPFSPISLLRSMGVNLVNQSRWLKRKIMREAMGISKPL